jgi:hypothetical protein
MSGHKQRKTSLSARAVAYLKTKPPRTKMPTSELAAALGCLSENLSNCLGFAVKHGFLWREIRPTVGKRVTYFWSLPDPDFTHEGEDTFSRLAFSQLGEQRPWRALEGVQDEEAEAA